MPKLLSRDVDVKSVCPSVGELSAMALAAIGLRILLLLATSIVYHKTYSSFSKVGDGPSYIAYARSLLGERGVMTEYDRRVFFGYPLVIAAVRLLGVPWELAALGTTMIAAGLASVFSAVITQRREVGWAMVCLTPHYLLYSSVVMNEALLLACCVVGLMLALKGLRAEFAKSDHRRWIYPACGGLIMGFGGLVRPFACFAVAGYIFHAVRQRQWRAAAIVAVVSAAVVGAGAVGLYLATGDALQGIKVYRDNSSAYQGELYTYPFKSLIRHSVHGNVPKAKLLYIWAYVVVDFTAVGILSVQLIKRWRQHRERVDLFWMWLSGNTLVILCIGSVWGFEAFHRFSSWALPAELFALAPILPRRVWSWLIVTAFSFAIALYSINRN